MPYLPSGWTFITLQFLVRCGYALVIPERANETVFVRDITIDQKARSTNIALAIAGGVVLLVLMIGILLLYLTQRSASARIPDVEPGTVPKPQWWMVEGKNEKMGWWKLGSGNDNSPAGELDNGSRIERLKAALQVRKAAKNGQIPSPVLPLQTDPDTQHKYPDVLERGFRAPVYPFHSSPQIPSITRTMYDGSNHLNPPLPAIVTEGQRVTLSRTGAPRSPAGRRRSRDRLSRQFRNPFLPLKDSDVTVPKISAPMPATIDPSNPKLQPALSLSLPHSPQKVGVRRPAPLAPILFEPETPLASGPISRLGIPVSPRPQMSSRISPRPPNSARPPNSSMLPNSPRPPVASPRF
jgi:hypothetical protein